MPEKNTVSKDLSLIKELLSSENINSEQAFEFFCDENKLETMKSEIRKKAKNECYFFVKPENHKLHVIAIVNIKLEKLTKESKVADLLSQTDLKQGSFDPKGISFFKR